MDSADEGLNQPFRRRVGKCRFIKKFGWQKARMRKQDYIVEEIQLFREKWSNASRIGKKQE